jgi:hypothetical protein
MDLFYLDYCFNLLNSEDAAESPPKAIVNARHALSKDSEGRATLKVAYGDQVSSRDCLERCLIFIAKFFENEEEIKSLISLITEAAQDLFD